MRLAWTALVLFVSACAPFEGTRSLEDYAQPSLEEAFPGARVTGEGVAVFDLKEGASVEVPFVVQQGMAVAGEDMILGPADALLQRSAGLRHSSRRWDTCTIPYSLDSSLTSSARSAFLSAAEHWEQNTGLRFEENPAAANRIDVRGGSGCSSYIGQIGGAQSLTLARNCGRGSAIHEIGHAMGFFHEQSRSDRDEYVTVHWDNIQAGREHNFRTYTQNNRAGVDLGAYDVGSIMHYGSWAFATGSCWSGNTAGCAITHADGSYLNENQRIRLSSGDLAGIQELYGHCSNSSIDDHGDTIDDATVVNGPMQMSGTLHADDTDVFLIHAEIGRQVTVYTTGTTDTEGHLLRDGLLVAADGESGPGNNFQLSWVATDSAHHVRVRGDVGDYTLHVETQDPSDRGDDHGDSLDQATVVTTSTSLIGNLSPGDEDYFLLDVPPGSTVVIGTSGATDTVGDLLVNGVQVLTDDTTGAGPNFELSFTTVAGENHVRVKGWRSWVEGTYTLNIDVELPEGGDDHGDTEATATVVPLPVGSFGMQAMLDAGDTDVFRIEVAEAGLLSAFTEGDTDTYGTLYDSNGVVLDENDDSTGLQFAVASSVQPGSYFLFVRGYSTTIEGGYSLSFGLE